MGRGRPIDQSGWPDDRPRRTFFELLDKVHREQGTKSLSAIAEEMGLSARSRVSALLRGTLPADERQVSDLIRALGGSDGDIGRGLMLYRTIRSASGEVPLAQAGWSLAGDPEGVRHWQPRARGVSSDGERGWRFRGRTAALARIVSWLEQSRPGRQVLVITGSPGAGKSAVLGRVVTTADARVRAALPPEDTGVVAAVGSVSCAVHADGKTALEIAREIARAAAIAPPAEPGDLAPAIRKAAGGRAEARFSVVIDALDEMEGPEQARMVIDSVILPLAESCSDAGVQVIVGTRRRDDGGDLLGRFGAALDLLDLDDPRYFEEEDLAAYALACLQLAGDERPDNPYASNGTAVPLAARIAETAGRNFLIAGLIARTHGLHDKQAADPARLAATATVRSALEGYLNRLPPVGGVNAGRLLTALAFAEAPGLPAGLWQLAVKALYRADIDAEDLAFFARSSAANFLVETTSHAAVGSGDLVGTLSYRLFHHALSDTLVTTRQDLFATSRAADERALTLALTEHGREVSWQGVPEYLLRSLPGHAHAAGLTDSLLTDDAYLLHADLRRLVQVADAASSREARSRARLLRLTPEAVTVGPADRAAMFSVTGVLDNLDTAFGNGRWEAPYHVRWATTRPRTEHASFTCHQGGIYAMCAVGVDGRTLLASGGHIDRTTRIPEATVLLWDPWTCEISVVLRGHENVAVALCAVGVDGRTLLASGSADGTVRLWDPRTGEQLAVMQGHQGGVGSVCAVDLDGRILLASGGGDGGIDGGYDRTVRMWDPRTGEQQAIMQGHQGLVDALCAVDVDGRTLLASGGSDDTVRVWDPWTGEQQAVLQGHQGRVKAVCAVDVDGRTLLASGSADDTVRLWDPRTGEQQAATQGHQRKVYSLCPVELDGRTLLASGSADGAVRLWDPRTGEQQAIMQGHQRGVYSLCPVDVDGRTLLATSADGAVRLWDPRTGEQQAIMQGHQSEVGPVCSVATDGRTLLASGGRDGAVRVWDPRTGRQVAASQMHQCLLYAVCAVDVDGRTLLASGGGGESHSYLALNDRTVRVWDPRTGEQVTFMEGHRRDVYSLCAVDVDGRALLASGSADGAVRLWDPRTGEQLAALQGHEGWVYAVCAVDVDGCTLLASGSRDRTVRLWDPRTGTCKLTVPTHRSVYAVTGVAGSLAIGLDDGILVIKLNSAA
jgi:WD40 repeat protein